MRLAQGLDYVQMRDGSSFVGTVTQDSFQVSLGFTTISIATRNIVRIEFHYGSVPTDQVRLKDSSSVNGSVLDPVVRFRSETLGDIEIPTAEILAIQLLGNL